MTRTRLIVRDRARPAILVQNSVLDMVALSGDVAVRGKSVAPWFHVHIWFSRRA